MHGMFQLRKLFVIVPLAFTLNTTVFAETDAEARIRLEREIADYHSNSVTTETARDTDVSLHSIKNEDVYPVSNVQITYDAMAELFGYGNTTTNDSYDTSPLMAFTSWNVLYDESTIVQEYSSGMGYSYNNTILNYSDEELALLKQIVAAEAGDQGLVGMQMVAEVVVNRVRDSRFPNNIKDVILAPSQFTPITNGTFYMAYDHLSDNAKADVDLAVANALAGSSASGGALYFKTLGYHDNTTPIMQFGAHYFSK